MHGGAIIWGRDQWSIAEITSQMAIYIYINYEYSGQLTRTLTNLLKF